MGLDKPGAIGSEKVRRGSGPVLRAILSQSDLLQVLDADPSRAENRYADLYHKLVRYFRWNRVSEPEDLAQEAVKRSLARLQQGQKITAENPESYFFGVARNLLREGWNARAEEPWVEEQDPPPPPLFRKLIREEQIVFLAECTRDLSSRELEMLMAYMAGEGDSWARKAGMQKSTLRSRIHRLRKRLEAL